MNHELVCAIAVMSAVACNAESAHKQNAQLPSESTGFRTQRLAVPSDEPSAEPSTERPSKPCGLHFGDAPFWLMTEDAKIEIAAYAFPTEELTASQVYRRYEVDFTHEGKDFISRDESALRIEWLDPTCDDPHQGTVTVKNAGTFRAVLMCQWPVSQEERAKVICAAVLPNLRVLPPSGCATRPWMKTPGRAIISLPHANVREPMRAESHPSSICPPFPFAMHAFGKPSRE